MEYHGAALQGISPGSSVRVCEITVVTRVPQTVILRAPGPGIRHVGIIASRVATGNHADDLLLPQCCRVAPMLPRGTSSHDNSPLAPVPLGVTSHLLLENADWMANGHQARFAGRPWDIGSCQISMLN